MVPLSFIWLTLFARNRQTAEDLSQEIFIKCYEKLDGFRGEAGIQTWLYRIAVNHCKDYVKSWHYRKVHASEMIASLMPGKQDGAESEYFVRAEQDELIEAVFRLPLKYKEVIVLAYFHDLTMKEISEVCDVNINTVKSRAAKAKDLLKQQLSERGGMNGGKITGGKDENAQGRIG
ncbi:sigma-70 family RNA polymerase sigma factor [Bacillus sp. B-jedd]|uniref:sigma-70 family RNA polymerase sigma factor n=1 Tax=Bacillus sp. B-jedd TaxID=1476857 RepID=UPI000515679F|nr:sigma-70 family RNA polymerase sigma factor [Bacillus sp. B-jedd]CEG28831.1 ECF subfamily RNA polymerase sigma-24 subunit [Bacillus sp. B-jedd]